MFNSNRSLWFDNKPHESIEKCYKKNCLHILGHGLMMTSSNENIFCITGHLCGEFTDPGEFPTQRPVTWIFDVLFDLCLNKWLSKQPWGWWFETPSWSLWRQCNVFDKMWEAAGCVISTCRCMLCVNSQSEIVTVYIGLIIEHTSICICIRPVAPFTNMV